MNKKVYIIGTVIVVLLIVISMLSGTNDTKNGDDAEFLATSTMSDVGATTAATSTAVAATSTRVAMYTMVEIAKNKDATSCWTAIDGGVYDLTKAVDSHPGGREKILSVCGKDGSQAFGKQHGGQEIPESALATLKIGELGL